MGINITSNVTGKGNLMNKELTKLLKSHRSIRKYKNKPISESILEDLLLCAQSAPTSHNVQAYSIIIIKDKEKKENLSKLCSDQRWIIDCPVFLVFCSDFYRHKLASEMHNTKFDISEIENILVGSIDAAIAANNLYIAGKAYGLGGVFIGDLRNNLEEVGKILNIPKLVIPLFGMCIGYPDDLPLRKPRLPLNTVVHIDAYNEDKQTLEGLDEYDNTLSDYYYKRTNGKRREDWTSQMAEYFSTLRQPHIKDFLLKQGFQLK